MTTHEAKRIIEAILFVNERPLSVDKIKEILDGFDAGAIKSLIRELADEYKLGNRGIIITEVAGGFQISTNPAVSSWLKKFYKSRYSRKLSAASLECLAIVAYKQPITRAEIEFIRGVSVEGVLKNLLELGLVKIVGRKDAPGRPFVYGTTKGFLEYFGLNSLEELPDIEEFSKEAAELSYQAEPRIIQPNLPYQKQNGPAQIQTEGDEKK
jgi:segregation and condensation protein B